MWTIAMIVWIYLMLFFAYYSGYHSARSQVGKKVFMVWLEDMRKIDVDRFYHSMVIYEKMWSGYVHADLHVRLVRWIQGRKIMAKFPKFDIYLDKKLTKYIALVGGDYTPEKQVASDLVHANRQ